MPQGFEPLKEIHAVDEQREWCRPRRDPVCQCALAAVFALGGGGSCRVDRYDVRVMRYEVGALGWVSAAFVV